MQKIKKLRCISVIILFLTGCSGLQNPFDNYGIPKQSYIVGAGFDITYKATSDGTVYFVESNSKKIIQSESLKSGEMYYSEGDLDPEKFKTYFGFNIIEAKFVLYFVPKSE